ncbi:GntR family transcriptional regulator [Candidatus Magnetomorum sp. HK-1]|nr:GntR family transcriptional regulator [Candidatus Magnetomorum sp. HK-1]
MSLKNRQNMAEEIANYLSEKIIRLELAPGERILEAKVAEELNVSRSPVREALRILEKYQLIELMPRRGVKVKDITPEYISCLFDIMIELLGLMARLCCLNRTDDELVKMIQLEEKAYNSACEENMSDYYESLYHYALTTLKASKNPLLAQMIKDWLPGFRRAYFLFLSYSPYNLSESAKMFREINQHIIDGEHEIAEEKVKNYTRLEKKRLLEIIQTFMPFSKHI